jgi:hypothetical protein
MIKLAAVNKGISDHMTVFQTKSEQIKKYHNTSKQIKVNQSIPEQILVYQNTSRYVSANQTIWKQIQILLQEARNGGIENDKNERHTARTR